MFVLCSFLSILSWTGNVLKRLLAGQNFSDISILCSYLLETSISLWFSLFIYPHSVRHIPIFPSVWNKINQFTLLVFGSWILSEDKGFSQMKEIIHRYTRTAGFAQKVLVSCLAQSLIRLLLTSQPPMLVRPLMLVTILMLVQTPNT